MRLKEKAFYFSSICFKSPLCSVSSFYSNTMKTFQRVSHLTLACAFEIMIFCFPLKMLSVTCGCNYMHALVSKLFVVYKPDISYLRQFFHTATEEDVDWPPAEAQKSQSSQQGDLCICDIQVRMQTSCCSLIAFPLS